MKRLIIVLLLFSLTADAKIIYDNSIIKRSRTSIINDNTLKALENKKKEWHYKDIQKLTKVLLIGEKEFNLNHKVVLGIISIESEFKKNAINKNKKSIDYGLGQINSKNWNKLSRRSKQILTKHNISFNNAKYDLALNVMNSFVHLNDNKNELKRKGRLTFKTLVQSYNCGVRGTLSHDFAVKQKEDYWKGFLRNYEVLL